MHTDEYTRMEELESSMWWYKGLHANVLNAIVHHAPDMDSLLDAGCGTGGMLKVIRERFPNARLHGLDLSEQACSAARAKTRATISQGSVDALTHADRSFDVVISLDVLGYDLDLQATLNGFFRVLRPGGHLILNLPAYQWMLSYHDHAVGQVRRFERSQMRTLLENHDFKVERATYWNTLLFPLMAIRRKVLPGSSTSDVERNSPLMENSLGACLSVERLMLDRQISLPFGGSILLIAERPAR